MRKTVVIPIVLAGVVLTAVIVKLAAPTGSARRVREFPVEEREVASVLTERGWLVSLDTEPVELDMTGDLLELASSGTEVQEGDVIVRIDDARALERLETVKYNTSQAEQSKASSLAELEYLALVESNKLTRLRKQLAWATLKEEEARRGLKPEDRRLLEIEHALAKLDLADAREARERQEKLLAKHFISRAMFEPYRRRELTRKAAVSEVEARIRIEEKGVPAERLLELRREVERIEGLLSRGEKAAARRLEQVQRQIDVAEARLKENLHDREQIDDELAASEILAPRAGILSVRVVYENQIGQWMEYKPGVTVRKNDRIADIVNPGSVQVEIMIHEADIDRVRIGMPAKTRVPAFPDRVFEGKIVELGGVGRDRSVVAPKGYENGRAGIAMFNAVVSLEGNGVAFRPGMSAIVELVLAPPRNILTVARAAVRRHPDGSWQTTVMDGDVPRTATVTGHILDDQTFLVASGLRKGELAVVIEEAEDAP